MCGILGAYGDDVQRIGPAAEAQALASIAHRGPDASVSARNGNLLLGHLRLAIIDLDPRSHQPMTRGPLTIVYNGEIYNYRSLKTALEEGGASFSTTSDTEVLLEGLLRDGVDFLQKVEGMFAFAVFDDRDRSLTLARDRYGEKPLFVCERPGTVIFASEIAAIEALSPEPLEEDPTALGLYLRLSYVPAPYAPLKSVGQLEPGTWRRYTAQHERDEGRYYALADEDERSIGYDDAIAETRKRLTASVDLRLKTADVPVATLLSGGIDSSIVTAIAAGVSDNPVTAYSLSFPDDPDFDEGRYAVSAAKQIGDLDHRLVPARVGDLLDFTETIFARLSEPLADASLVPTSYLMSHIGEKVVLGGDGADEIFAGYGTYASMRLSGALPGLLKRLLTALPAHSNPARIRQPVLRAAALFHANLADDPLSEYLNWRSYAQPDDLKALGLDVDLKEAVGGSTGRARSGSLRDIQKVDIAFNLPNDMLRKVDIAGMMFGIEARLPYLDSGLVHFALSLPDNYRIRGGVRKRILRDAFSRDLPEEILTRRKMGFLMPIRQWFRGGPLRDRLIDLSNVQTRFDSTVIDRLVDEHKRGTADHSVLLWALLVYLQWRDGRQDRAAALVA